MSAPIDNEAFRNLLYSWPEKAVAYLYERYYDDLLRTADLYTGDRYLSEDAVQEVLLDVFNRHKILGMHHDQPITAYLFKAVTNQAIDLYKKQLRTNVHETRYFYSADSTGAASADVRIISSENESLLRTAIDSLTKRERECILMQTEEKLAVKEIATRLGITTKAVERNLTSARRRLRGFRNPLAN